MESITAYFIIEHILYLYQRKLRLDYLTILLLRAGALFPILDIPATIIFGFTYIQSNYWIFSPISQIFFWFVLYLLHLIYFKNPKHSFFLLAPILGQLPVWVLKLPAAEYFPLLAPFQKEDYSLGVINSSIYPFLAVFAGWIAVKSGIKHKRVVRYISLSAALILILVFLNFSRMSNQELTAKHPEAEVVRNIPEMLIPWRFVALIQRPDERIIVKYSAFGGTADEVNLSKNDFGNNIHFHFYEDEFGDIIGTERFTSNVVGIEKEAGLEIMVENVFYDQIPFTVRMFHVVMDKKGVPISYRSVFSVFGRDVGF